MSGLDDELRGRLDEIEAAGLRRWLRRIDSPQGVRIDLEGKSVINFSSNDYLGLAASPALREAASEAMGSYGVGSGASRLICGSIAPHEQLEEEIAKFKGTEAAISFSSGYATALGTIPALVGKGDVIILDKLVHASIIDAARLSGAQLRVFPHNRLDQLERLLQRLDERTGHVLVVAESIYSMDGDQAPVTSLVELKERYGAWLMVDEAHATGLFGEKRRGLIDAVEMANLVDVQMGTLGKALGVSGGYICGSRTLIDYLVNRARSFIFSTAPLPVVSAAASAAIRLVASEEGKQRCDRLWQGVRRLRTGLEKMGERIVGECAVESSSVEGDSMASPIVPIEVGDESRAVAASQALLEGGIFVPAIRYPTVGRGRARLRLTVTADHSPKEVEIFLDEWHAIRERGRVR